MDQEILQAIQTTKDQLMAAIADFAGQLHTDIQQSEARVTARFEQRFDRLEARLELHQGLLNSGSRAIARVIEWSGKADEQMRDKERLIADLQDRLRKLEENGAT
jgi:chromosome segregation ATPase